MATKAIQVRRVYVKRPRSRRRAQTTIPLAVLAGFIPLGLSAVEGYKLGGPQKAVNHVVAGLTGYDPAVNKWDAAYLTRGAMPIVIGFAAHFLASKLGVNRALSRARVPLIRI